MTLKQTRLVTIGAILVAVLVSMAVISCQPKSRPITYQVAPTASATSTSTTYYVTNGASALVIGGVTYTVTNGSVTLLDVDYALYKPLIDNGTLVQTLPGAGVFVNANTVHVGTGAVLDVQSGSVVTLNTTISGSTTFVGPITSTGGFVGNTSGVHTGNVTGATYVTSTNLVGNLTGNASSTYVTTTNATVGGYLAVSPVASTTVTNTTGFTLLTSFQPITSTAAVTPSLNAAPAAGTVVVLENLGPYTITLANGGIQKFATFALGQYETKCLISDGTNYLSCTK